MGRRGRVVVDHRRPLRGPLRTVAAAHRELGRRQPPAQVARHPRQAHDERERQAQREDGQKGRRRQAQSQRFLSVREPMRTAADTTMAVTAGLMP
jgi:hypothetical protein